MVVCLFVLRNCCVGERGERGRIVDDKAPVKGHGRRHENLNLSISGTVPRGTMIMFFPSFVEKRKHVLIVAT